MERGALLSYFAESIFDTIAQCDRKEWMDENTASLLLAAFGST